MGIGSIAFGIYIVAIVFFTVVLHRHITQALLYALLLLIAVAWVAGFNVPSMLADGLMFATFQEATFAVLAFVYMAYVMEKTKVVQRLVNILDSLLGRLAGGAAYVSVIASALFGMVSGSGTGNASTVGSITIPWMEETGWSKERASTIIAGNAGLGIVFPPSSSMFLLLGMPIIAAEISSGDLYKTLLGAALCVLLYRIILVAVYVHRDGILPSTKGARPRLSDSLKKDWPALLIFLGILIPLLIAQGPLGSLLEKTSFGSAGVESISIIVWIPVITTLITMLVGRKSLPRTMHDWITFHREAVYQYKEIGFLILCAFTASRMLVKMGLETEMASILQSLGNTSPVLVIIAVALLITLTVGPFSATATTSALGSVTYIALRGIGLEPAAACTVFLLLISNEGCVPPSSAPIYISCGISGLEDPSKIFRPTLFHFALPTALIAILIAMKVIPTF